MKMNRREFLAGASALTLAGWREVAEAAGCPAYYADHLARAAARVTGLAKTCVGGCWFITDPHVRSNHCQSGILLSELVKRTPLKRVLCGGDLTEAFGKGYPTDRAAVDFAIEKYRSVWVEPIRAAGGAVYTARGNHDFTVCHSYDSPEDKRKGFTYDGKVAHDLIVARFSEKDVVFNAADPECCYFYFDVPEEKLRYVVADTTDRQRAGDVPWGTVYGVHAPQLKWLADEALAKTPDGWGVVMTYHIPVTGVVGNVNDLDFGEFRKMLEAYQNRGTCTIAGERRDFAQARGTILVNLTGHEHCEMETFQRGLLHVTNPCDAAYRDYINRSRPWCEFPPKTKGTVNEQTFDAVQFDPVRRLVHFTRIGGGYDRVFHLDPVRVEAGKPRQLAAPLLKGTVKWGCYDADRVTDVPDPRNRFMKLAQYHNDFATISADGLLTPLKAGESMAIAMDAALNKEIFPVAVA